MNEWSTLWVNRAGSAFTAGDSDEHDEDDEFHADDDDFGPCDQLVAHQVHRDDDHDEPDPDGLAGPARRLPRQQCQQVAGEPRCVQGHRDDPAEELKDVEPARDDAVAETPDQVLRGPAATGIDRTEFGVGVRR